MFPILRYISFFFLAALLFPGFCLSEELPSVGVILPLSGSLAAYGEKIKRGVELAVIKSKTPPRFIYEDGQSETKNAVTAFKKLTSLGDIKYIIGPFGPDQTLAIASQALKAEVLLVAASMCDGRYQKYKNIFCIYPSALSQLEPLYYEFDNSRRAVKSAAILLQNMESAEYVEPSLRGYAQKNQITDFYLERFDGAETDFRSQLIKIKAKKPDLFVVGGHPRNAVQILKQKHQLGFASKYTWYLSEHDNVLFEQNKKALEGAYTEGSPKKENPSFISDYKKRYKEEPDFYHALGYDAAKFLIKTLSKDSSNLKEVTDSLTSLRDKNTAIPGFHFNPDRTVSLELQVTQIKQGKKVPTGE